MNQDITLCASTVCPNMHQCHRATAIPKAVQAYCDFYHEGHVCASYWPLNATAQKEEQK